MSCGLWIQRFQVLSWQPLFGTLDQMPLSWVLPRRHLAQGSENLPESPASTERAAQLAQILAVSQPEQREVNPKNPWEVGCTQWCRRPGIEGLTSWLLFGTGAVSFEEMESQRTLTVRWSAPPVMVVGAGSAEVTARVLPISCGNGGGGWRGTPPLSPDFQQCRRWRKCKVFEEFLNFL